jgi:hypothetical protein
MTTAADAKPVITLCLLAPREPPHATKFCALREVAEQRASAPPPAELCRRGRLSVGLQ